MSRFGIDDYAIRHAWVGFRFLLGSFFIDMAFL